jgi:hypothetical protein
VCGRAGHVSCVCRRKAALARVQDRHAEKETQAGMHAVYKTHLLYWAKEVS